MAGGRWPLRVLRRLRRCPYSDGLPAWRRRRRRRRLRRSCAAAYCAPAPPPPAPEWSSERVPQQRGDTECQLRPTQCDAAITYRTVAPAARLRPHRRGGARRGGWIGGSGCCCGASANMMAEVSADGGKRGGGSKELVLADGCCERAAGQAHCFHIQEFLFAKNFTNLQFGKIVKA